MNHIRTRLSTFLVIAGLMALLVGFQGCSNEDTAPTTPIAQAPQDNGPDLHATMAIQDLHTPALMASPDVIGTATTIGPDGQPAILVLVTSDKAVTKMPSNLDGVAVQVLLTDRIVAMKGKPGGGGGGGGVSHTAKQSTPIQLGTSGGWSYDLANGYCCGGTLGSLIQVGGQKRILSNYHVFEADIVNGGNSRTAQTGDPIIQPGLIDVNCNAGSAQQVATLVVSELAALVQRGLLLRHHHQRHGGPERRHPGDRHPQQPDRGGVVNQAVKKSGRTTGLTRSSVSGLNATVSVSYEDECAGSTAFTKTYTGQIIIANRRSKFLGSGDSGSLMVEDVSTNPRAVGLLFAGSSQTAVANPIDDVLNFFGATMVGN